MGRKHTTAALILILFGVAYGYQTMLLPVRTLPHTPSPSFFPWLLTVALLTLATALLVQGLKDTVPGVWWVETPAALIKPGTGLLLFIAYVIALPTLGFVAASIPFFAGMMCLAGERRLLWVLVPSIAIPIVLFGMFRYLFRILLPQAEFWAILWG